MSREIKFRVWAGDHMEHSVLVGCGIAVYADEEYGTIANPDDPASITPCNTIYPCDTEVMQYTGLKDKNGVEVYEGDILAIESEVERSSYCIYRVVYVEEKGKFMCKPVCDCEMYDTFIVLNHCDRAGEYAVIGNVHQNPELLG